MKKVSRELVVGNERGVHSRIATRLAEIATQYKVTLTLEREGETAECTMILDVLALGLVHGQQLLVHAEGSESEAALKAVEQLLTSREDP